MVKCHACNGNGSFDQHETCLYCEGSGIQEIGEERTMEDKGLIVKYDVRKVDTGELVNNCFVLRPDKDEAAFTALKAYAEKTTNEELRKDINQWLDSILAEKTKELKAFAIGPDRYEVVVGYDRESVVEWYKQQTGISEADFAEYDVDEYPMDKPVQIDARNGMGREIITLREYISDVKDFPCLAWFMD